MILCCRCLRRLFLQICVFPEAAVGNHRLASNGTLSSLLAKKLMAGSAEIVCVHDAILAEEVVEHHHSVMDALILLDDAGHGFAFLGDRTPANFHGIYSADCAAAYPFCNLLIHRPNQTVRYVNDSRHLGRRSRRLPIRKRQARNFEHVAVS
jgi:hypothetical protein